MSINEENPNYDPPELQDTSLDVNGFEQYIPNKSLRGVSRYIDLQVNRIESDPITSLVYRSKEIYNQFSSITDTQGKPQHIGYDVFHKILGTDNYKQADQQQTLNPSISQLSSEPNLVSRFLHSSYGVNSSPGEDTSTILPGIKSSTPSLIRNMSVNPAVVAELKKTMLGGKSHGYTLGGFESRFINPASISPSPVIVGAAYYALEESLKHRSNKEIIKAAIGFQSRPDASFYQRLLVGPTLDDPNNKVNLEATFFQFQNTEIMQALFGKGVSFNIVTQTLDRSTFQGEGNNTRVGIFAGNELLLNATQAINPDTELGKKESQGVRYHHSFHPKVGYMSFTLNSGKNQFEIAFIGTQNITAATSRHSTIESMLFVRSDSNFNIEQSLFKEIKSFQDLVSGKNKDSQSFVEFLNAGADAIDKETNPADKMAAQKKLYKDSTDFLKKRLNSNYLFFNDQIFGSTDSSGNTIEGEYTKLLKEVNSNTNLTAVVSFDYINDMSTDGIKRHAFTVQLLELAKNNRVQVIISSGDYQKAMNGLNNSVDRYLLTSLAQQGALNLSVTGKHHDKSIAVYDNSGNLRALGIGSANPTKTSAGIVRRDSSGKLVDDGGNIEVAAVISAINSSKESDEFKYLESLQIGGIDSHYFGLTGGAIENNIGFQKRRNIARPLSKAYKTESPALLLVKEQERVHSIIRLKDAINQYTQTGSDPNSKYGSIVATLRYEPQLRSKFDYGGYDAVKNWGNKTYSNLANMSYYDAPIGLRITIKGPDGYHTLSFDATVTEEGNILIPDLNKIINGAIWVNKSNVPITLFNKDEIPSWDTDFIAKRTINPGDPGTKLTPFETLLAFTETVQRSFIYQQEFGLVDIMFRDSVRQDETAVISKIKLLFEDAFASALTEQFSFSTDNKQILNLKTILSSLRQKLDLSNTESKSSYLSVLNQVAEYMATQTLGKSIINRGVLDAEARKKIILESLMETLKIDENSSNLLKLDDLVAKRFLKSLLRTNTTYFNDYRKELIYKFEESRARYKSASLTQSRTLLDELLSSFLAVHEETYAYYQGQERLGIFGETTTFHGYGDDSVIAKQYQAGLLNPLAISHSSMVASPGVLYRSLSSTSHGNTLMLPAFGGLKQLTVTDSDLSSGASVGQEFLSGMGKSSPGFMVLDKDTVKNTFSTILNALNNPNLNSQDLLEDNKLDVTRELEESLEVLNVTFGTSTQLIYTPFEKLEQLTQRIKNVVGFRPALEFSEDFALSLINLFGNESQTETIREYFNLLHKRTGNPTSILNFASYLESYNPKDVNPNSLLEGQLRFSLPEKQYLALKESIALLSSGGTTPTYEQVQDYYRRLLLKQGNVQHGFIGGAKYKRMALNLGTSFMGDFSYLNPDYQYTPVGDSNGALRTPIYGKIHNLRIKFNPERVDNVPSIITELIKLFGEGGAVAITQTIDDKKPGLYQINRDGSLSSKLIGTFTDTGLIKLDMDRVSLNHKGNYGVRKEPFLIKVPAKAKSTEGGMTYIAPSPHLVDTARTTNIIELDTYTIFRPGTSSRIGGGGLKKGPVVFLEKDFFTKFKAPSLLSQEFQKDKVYGMASMGTFKGVNVETGLVLLQDAQFRKTLTDDTSTLLITLASLFTADSEVKESLIRYLQHDSRKDFLGAAALLTTKGIDISKGTIPIQGKVDKDVNKNTLAYTASGLLMLAGKEAVAKQDFNFLKKAVLAALNNEGDSLDTLKKNLTTLIELATHESQSTKLNDFYIFNDSNPITKGLAVLSHLFYYSSQIYDKDKQTNKFHQRIYEIGLNQQDLYIGKDISEVAGFSTEDYRNFVHQTLKVMGFSPKNIDDAKDTDALAYNLELMRLAHTRLDNQFIIETITDTQVSQSLVASGMRDVVKQEYQFYIGMMNKKLNQYRSSVGEQGVSIQKAYLEAIAVSEGDLNAMVREQTLSFRLALSSIDSFTGKNESLFDQPGSILRYQDLRLRDLALLYSPNVAEANSEYAKDYNLAVLNIATSNRYNEIESSLLYTAAQLDANKSHIAEVTSAGYSKGLITMASLLRKQLSASRAKTDFKDDITKLGTEQYNRVLQKTLDSITKSQRIVLPYIEFHQTEDGRFIGAMRPTSSHNPTSGILLGSDFVTRIGQSYGDFETEIMQNQVRLVEALNRAQPVLDKFMGAYYGSTNEIPLFSDHERNLILELRAALDMSAKSLIEIPVTDISRQYAGDHESMAGAVGIAVNSFALRPDEILLGQRYLRIAGTQDTGKNFTEKNSILGTTINAILSKDKLDLDSIKMILSTYGDGSLFDSKGNIDVRSYDELFKLEKREHINSVIKQSLDKLNIVGTVDKENIGTLKKLLVRAKLYTDIFGFKGILKTESEKTLGISSSLLKAIILDHSSFDKNTNINTILDGLFKNNKANFTLEKLAYLNAGFTFSRTGQPGGSSGLDSDLNEFIAIHLEKYLTRVEELDGGIKIDQSRLDTGVVVPSISRLISGLGDYDGDSYRLTMKIVQSKDTSVESSETALHLKTQRDQLDREIKFKQTVINNKIQNQPYNFDAYKQYILNSGKKHTAEFTQYLDNLSEDKDLNLAKLPISPEYLDTTNSSRKILEAITKSFNSNSSNATFQLPFESDSIYLDYFNEIKKAYNTVAKNESTVESVKIGNQTLYITRGDLDKSVDLMGANTTLKSIFSKNVFTPKGPLNIDTIDLFFSSLAAPAQKLALFNELLTGELRQSFTDFLKNQNISSENFRRLSLADKSKYTIDFLSNKKRIKKLAEEGIYVQITQDKQKTKSYLNIASTQEIGYTQYTLDAIEKYNQDRANLRTLNKATLSYLKTDHYNKDFFKSYYSSVKSITDFHSRFTKKSDYLSVFTESNLSDKSYIELDSDFKTNLKSSLDKLSTTTSTEITTFIENIKTTLIDTDKTKFTSTSLDNLITSLSTSYSNNIPKDLNQLGEYTNLLYLMDSLINKLTSDDSKSSQSYLRRKLLDFSSQLIEGYSNLTEMQRAAEGDADYPEFIKNMNEIDSLIQSQKKLRDTRRTLDKEYDELLMPSLIGRLTDPEIITRKKEARQLKDLERFIKSYTNLPAFMFTEVAGQKTYNTGELISFISQKYDFGNIEDSAPFNKYSLIQSLLIKANTTDIKSTVNINETTLGSSALVEITKDMLKLSADAKTISVESLLNMMGVKTRDAEGNQVTKAADLTLETLSNLVETPSSTEFSEIYGKVQLVTQQSQGLEILDKKLLGRHLNVLLTPEEFTTAIGEIGLAGTDLIGRAYNTLIPLLDTLVIEQSFMYSQVSKSLKGALSSKDAYKDLAVSLGVEVEGTDPNVAKQNRIKIREKFAGTISILSNFQQIVRDAIKAKEGGSILEKFHEYSTYGEDINSLINILTTGLNEGESSHQSEKDMRAAMSIFLKSSMGPDLDRNNQITTVQLKRMFNMLPNQEVDMFKHILDVSEAVTGFGALYYLDSYTRTADNENFYEKFITNSIFGDQSQYFEEWAKIHHGTESANVQNWATPEYQHVVKNFVSSQIINLMQRAQVSFSLSSIKDDNVQLVANRLKNIVTTFEANLKASDTYQNRPIILKQDDQVLYTLANFDDSEIKALLNLADAKSMNSDLEGLLNIEYSKHTQDDVVKQFRYQYQLYKIFEELSKQKDSNKDKLTRQLVSSIMLTQMQDRDKDYGILTPETIEYLRLSAIDLSLLTSDDLNNIDPSDKMKLASRYAYTSMLRGLRSGKITDTATALEASQFKLGTILTILDENNITVDDLFPKSDSNENNVKGIKNPDDTNLKTIKNQLETLFENQRKYGQQFIKEGESLPDEVKDAINKSKLAGIVNSLVKTTGLDETASAKLLSFMVDTFYVNEKGDIVEKPPEENKGTVRKATGFQLIAEQSAGLATIEKLVQASQRAYEAGDYTLAEALDSRLKEYNASISANNNTFNNPIVLDVNDYNLDLALARQAEDRVQQMISETQNNLETHEEKTSKRRLGVMQSAPIAGILAGPLLFALASSDLEVDERVGMFAYDVLQGAAELSTRPSSTYSQYVGTQSHGAYGFRMARISQSVQTHGLVYGLGMGLSTELLYKGIGEVSDQIIGATLGRRAAITPNLGTVGFAAAAEVLAAVLSQGATRAISARVMKRAKHDYEAQQNYQALRQQLSQQRLDAYNAQGDNTLYAEDSETSNTEVIEELDHIVFTNISEHEVNKITGLDLILINSDDHQMNIFEDPSDPYVTMTADGLRDVEGAYDA